MLISIQNILGGQLSAIGSQHLEIDLPLSKSESNRALMIMHYYGVQELKTQRHRAAKAQSCKVSWRLCDFETLRLCVFEKECCIEVWCSFFYYRKFFNYTS